jgi:hypothetical protein
VGTVINVGLAILIGSFSVAMVAPEVQGPSFQSKTPFQDVLTFFQRSPKDKLPRPNCLPPLTAFPKSIHLIRTGLNLKVSSATSL